MATNAIDAVQKHFAKDTVKPVATRAQNGILKNIMEKKDKSLNQNSGKSSRSDVSEPSLYMTALENMLVLCLLHFIILDTLLPSLR